MEVHDAVLRHQRVRRRRYGRLEIGIIPTAQGHKKIGIAAAIQSEIGRDRVTACRQRPKLLAREA